MAYGSYDTHDAVNQPSAFVGRNLFETDPILTGAVDGVLDGTAEEDLFRLGAFWGSAEAHEIARLAERHPPSLRTHDPHGRRLDLVEYHPAYHAMQRRAVEHGLAASLWEPGIIDVGARHAARAVRLFLAAQGECAHLAAASATSAAIAALTAGSEFVRTWRHALLSRRYDHRPLPVELKTGASVAFAVAETGAGSDLAGMTTRAEPGPDGAARLFGHKWFVTAPMSDGLLTVARAAEGPSLFLVPRLTPDGVGNRLHLMRLKDKLGCRGEASAEVVLSGALAFRLGTPGGAAQALVEPTRLLRFDRAVAAAGLMRAALCEAAHLARHRSAFGARLVDHALMQRVLADMALDVAAATALVVRLARAFDNAATDPAEAAYARLVTPLAKYWISKIAPTLIAEAIECLGGNGCVEEFRLARFYRDAPMLAVADGPGSILALDALGVIEAGEGTLGLVLAEIERDLGRNQVVAFADLASAAEACLSDVGSARVVAEQIALAAAAAALRRSAPRLLSDAFLDSRVAGPWRSTYGMLDARFDPAGIVNYVVPE